MKAAASSPFIIEQLKTQDSLSTLPQYKAIAAPSKRDLFLIRLLIFTVFLLVIQFCYWYLNPSHIGYSILFWILTFSFGYKILHLLYEWYHFAAIKVPQWHPPTREWTVDMLTTYVPGEPYDMIVETLKAMVNVRYPHTSYLCDEGNDPYLQQVCKELGVVHVYRGKDKKGAKAGNINYALHHVAKGELCVILDPDHVPVPEFLDRVVSYFEDPKIGYVQCIQGYANHHESFIARGAAEQTYLFYGPLMMGMHRYGTAQAIGANCTFRREALDSIGGHAAGLCEDMHTSMQLHAKKWQSVYIPELLTRGRVPASVSAYYQQQLKWSRGSFELLFEVYPKLFRSWNWRQRLHYFLTPLYFFYGVIGFIDIIIPPVSLLSYQVPLHIEFNEFLIHVLPLLVGISLIRHFTQRYVLDKHEHGFHFTGGVLRVGTWWIYLIGFIYSIFRIKVPYIPTPKDGELVNDWRNSIPNLAMIGINFFAIIYGLQKDFTPFTLIMAGFAGMNIFLLGRMVLAGQQKLYYNLSDMLSLQKRTAIAANWSSAFRHNFVYRPLRHYLIASLFVVITLGTFAYFTYAPTKKTTLSDLAPSASKSFGELADAGFSASSDLSNPFHTTHYPLKGFSPLTLQACMAILQQSKSTATIPFITWEAPPLLQSDAQYTQEQLEGIHQIANVIRSYQHPVILSLDFSNVMDTTIGIRENYRNLESQFVAQGATNLSFAWLYSPENQQEFPGKGYVDFIVVQPNAQNGDYPMPASNKEQLPVLIASQANTDASSEKQLVQQLKEQQYQVLGTVQLSGKPALPDNNDNRSLLAFNDTPKKSISNNTPLLHHEFHAVDHTQDIVFDATNHHYNWLVNGKPFYIKGIVYNPDATWRDKGWPLTRRQLIYDFKMIKAMGANTISRTAPTVYDYNLMSVAKEQGLKVIYQFWFDPSIDYTRDNAKMADLKKEIINHIKKYKDQPAVLAWNLGNGTWNDLDIYFHQPHLSEVRLAYVNFIKEIAEAAHQLDKKHPILTTVNSDSDFSGALDDLQSVASAIDIIGVNGYDSDHLENVDTTLKKWLPDHPYLINEFGGKIDWDPRTSKLPLDDRYRLIEQSSFEKARLYARLWTNYIEKHKADNLGGIAYCWRDRLENTATVSGIIDYKGRLKPSYFSLKQVWTRQPQGFPLQDLWLRQDKIPLNQDESLLLFSAVSPNNNDHSLTYEWYLCREEYLNRTDELRINYKRLGPLRLKLIRGWRKRVLHKMYPMEEGRQIWIKSSDIDSLYRIYLHIYNDEGEVVTASYPISL